MPDVDGLEMTRQLKSHAEWNTITVVALTAYAMRGDEERIRQAGCDGYLPKPINVKTLADQVRAWVRPT